MFCPQCGQQQISNEIRFCSKCGLPLNLVAEVVAGGGTLPELERFYRKSKFLNRSNGLKFGLAWFLVITFLLTPLLAVMDFDTLVAITAILGFMGGLMIMLFSLMFLEKEPKSASSAEVIPATAANPSYLHGAAGKNALPPQQTYPVSDYTRPPVESWRSNTDDLPPASVTEETTKLLNKED
jgi:hypothetical protein